MFASGVFGSFTQKLQGKRSDGIFLVRGADPSGKAAWYYVEISKAKRDFFSRQSGVTSLNLLEYGKVIASGFGDNPPDHVVARMKSQYGFVESSHS